ncbi:MAG: DUF4124 domain-containing protein [Aquabacterium sp.]|nr:DUF4124 domain-containing protein [Aquabacterium sp.]
MLDSSAGRGLLLAAALLASLGAQAQIYKWVDDKGVTHYSTDKTAATRGAAVREVKVQARPAASAAPAGPAATPRTALPPPPAPAQQQPAPQPQQAQRSLSGGREHGTDASRCALARDVLSGAVRHGNGAPTDAHDIEVAQSDVRLFCR